jgi:hypothetical protein
LPSVYVALWTLRRPVNSVLESKVAATSPASKDYDEAPKALERKLAHVRNADVYAKRRRLEEEGLVLFTLLHIRVKAGFNDLLLLQREFREIAISEDRSEVKGLNRSLKIRIVWTEKSSVECIDKGVV